MNCYLLFPDESTIFLLMASWFHSHNFCLTDHILTYIIVNYLNNSNPTPLIHFPWSYKGYVNCPDITIYCISNMADPVQPFVLSEVNIIIKRKYPASGILDKLTTGQNLNSYSR